MVQTGRFLRFVTVVLFYVPLVVLHGENNILHAAGLRVRPLQEHWKYLPLVCSPTPRYPRGLAEGEIYSLFGSSFRIEAFEE